VIIRAAAAGSAVILAFLALLAVPGAHGWVLLPAVYLLLALVHTGVRVARKTYVIDMAGGDRRTEYVAVANTAMGALLLGTGAVSGVLALLGAEVALLFLALFGAVGVVTAPTLPEVSARSPIPNPPCPPSEAASPTTHVIDRDGRAQMLELSGGVPAGGSGAPPSVVVAGHARPRVYAVIDNDP
jgi:hypothetical protein